MSNDTSILAAFGFADAPQKQYAPKDSFWRDKNQDLWIADGGGLFHHADGKRHSIQEAWTGDKPGHGLVQVQCKLDHAEHVVILCEPAMAEEWPPGEEHLAALRVSCERKGLNGGWLQTTLKELGYKTAIGTDCWPRFNERGFTWKVVDAAYKAIIKERMIKRAQTEVSVKNEAPLIALEQQTNEEQTAWAEEESKNQSSSQSEETSSEAHQDAANADVVSEPITGTKTSAVTACTDSQPSQEITENQATAEVLLDLPSSVEPTDLERWHELAGLADVPFDVAISDDRANRIIGGIRSIQYRVSEAAAQAVKIIGTGLNAIDGLTRYYGTDLRDWAEPQLGVISKGQKAGQYRRKNVRTLSGAVFFKKAGGARLVNALEYKEHLQTLRREELAQFEIKEQFLFTLPPGYEVEVFKRGSDDPIDSEQYAENGITVKRDLKFSKRAIGSCVEAGEVLPGWVCDEADPLGNVTIGGDKAFSWRKLQKQMTDAVKKLALTGESADDEDQEDEE